MQAFFVFIAVTVAAAIAFVAGLVVIIPFVYPLVDRQLLAAALFTVVVAGHWRAWAKPSWWILAPLLVGFLLLPIMTVTAGFGEFDLLAAAHHIQFGMMGADMGIVIRALKPLVGAILIYVLCLYWIANLLRMPQRIYFFGAVLIATINPLSINVMNMVLTPRVENDLTTRVHKPVDSSPDVPADVLLIYIEGLDREFANETKYGDIYAGLESLRPTAIEFTQVKQVYGTSWSLAGIVASHCGLPLLPNGLRNMYKWDNQQQFLGDHDCLSDVLQNNGYQTAYVMGGVIEFGGIDMFLRAHGYDQILGRDQLRLLYGQETIDRAWAVRRLDDEMTLDTAMNVYRDMAAEPDPMLLTILTYGPHGKSGTMSRNCSVDGQAYETENIRATVRCNIENVRAFLSEWEELRRDRPALVVVMSDHLNHLWLQESEKAHEHRSNSFFVMGYDMPDVPRGVTNNRSGSMLDVYPTILSLLGMIQDGRAGLGVSLVGEAPTLLEEKGYYRVNRELNRNYELQQLIWGSD